MRSTHEQRSGTVVLVTGSSRGIGAETARRCAGREDIDTVIVHHRDENKAWMARRVAESVELSGTKCETIRADITDPDQNRSLAKAIAERCGRLDRVVLNASGGLEPFADGTDYAFRVNRDAQADLVEHLLPLMEDTGRFVYVTSHWSHFDQQDLGTYTPVATSKKAGEELLRRRFTEPPGPKAQLAVVSGDMVHDSTIVRLLDRMNPGWIKTRQAQVSELLDTGQFADTVVGALFSPQTTPVRTVYAGSTRL